MVSELLTIAAIGSILVGAILSTIKGYWNKPEGTKYDGKKLASSLVIASMAATSSINIASIITGLPDQLSTMGWFGLVISYLVFGFGLDQGLSTLDK